MDKNILIVEDESKMREFIGVYFRAEGFNVLEATNGKEAIEIFNDNEIDLIVLDIMMPELDGFETCREIRNNSEIPIIILTAVEGEDEEILSYELGADDYITKPFKGKVLVAKVKRLLQRFCELKVARSMSYGELELDIEGRIIFIEGAKVEFAPKEYDLITYLIENNGIVKSRYDILNRVWGYDYFGEPRVVDNHIKKIRKKLGKHSNYIKTIISVGYKFEVK